MYAKAIDNNDPLNDTPSQPLFSKEHERVREKPVRSGAKPVVIPPEMSVIGQVKVTGDLEVEGTIEGDIESRSVVVGEKAKVNGEIRAEDITVRGHVIGSLKARTILMTNASTVEGKILHQSLSVETGAFFSGESMYSDDPLGLGDKPVLKPPRRPRLRKKRDAG